MNVARIKVADVKCLSSPVVKNQLCIILGSDAALIHSGENAQAHGIAREAFGLFTCEIHDPTAVVTDVDAFFGSLVLTYIFTDHHGNSINNSVIGTRDQRRSRKRTGNDFA